MPSVQREVSDRTFFGKLMKWLFIGFNIIMFLWMASSCAAVSDVSAGAVNDAERAGAAIGAGLGMTFLLFVWGIGDVILGMFVLFTRRKKIITVEE
ncbi:Putative membrane protein [Sphingopyxis fribergensis]|uniref:Putative membrane protein n=1 Tax=Sphingopyxis fribergensis TaxID=1515612 RepID=A0A0A7PFE8_9SPHN|nr:hypothetical protein [Sphingopyxis fribergensis]AJA08851.1 Putative membrane protein [Sphingopyxis fribergensis]